jgi:hypothetical protein
MKFDLTGEEATELLSLLRALRGGIVVPGCGTYRDGEPRCGRRSTVGFSRREGDAERREVPHPKNSMGNRTSAAKSPAQSLRPRNHRQPPTAFETNNGRSALAAKHSPSAR